MDSDILIELSRARNETVLSRWIELSESDNVILYSPVTEAELWAGARPHEHAPLTRLFESLTCVSVDKDMGRQAGEYLRNYRKSHGMEIADALIASAALLNHAQLWTRNRKHYPMKDLTFY